MPPVDAVALALGAGAVAAVNPCGFALLPAYLSIFILDRARPRVAAIGRALRATAAMALGFSAVFAVFGLVITPVAASVQNYLPAFTVFLGLLLVVAGVWTLTGRSIGLPTWAWRRRSGPVIGSVISMVGFGASYAIASLGCTIAPFLAVVVTAFRSGSVPAGMTLFLAYAAGMTVIVGAAAVAIAVARTSVINAGRRLGGVLPRLIAVLLIIAGGYVAWYGLWELRVIFAGAGSDPVVDGAAMVQRFLSDLVSRIGVAGFAVALAVLVTGGLLLHRLRRSYSIGEPR